MKVCFLNPPRYQERINDDFTACFNVSRFSRGVDLVYAVTPPTELAILAGEVARRYEVEILDANAGNLLPREVFSWIKEQKPEYLVVKCGDTTLLDDLIYYYFAEGIGIKTIVWEDILNPVFTSDLLNDFKLKRILYGEPERNIFKFLDGALGAIGGDIIPDVNTLAEPLIDKLPMNKYIKEGKKNWYAFLNRGCGWGKCTFCLMAPSEITLRRRSVAHIKAELDGLKKYGIETIYFWDPQFNISHERVREVTNLLREYNFRWECWMRCDMVDDEIARNMKEAGCFRFHFGFENGSQKVLDSYNKGIKTEQIIEAFSLSRKYGIETAAYLVLGTPEESHKTFEETRALIKKIKPTTIVPASFRPFPNVPLTEQMQRENLLKRDHFSLAKFASCFGFETAARTKYLSEDELKEEMKKMHRLSTKIAVRSFIFRPWKWGGLVKPFFIRTLKNFLGKKKK